MRYFGLTLVLFASFVFGHATAQTDARPIESAAPTTGREFTPSHLGAARDALQVLCIDSGVFSEVGLAAFRVAVPTLRSTITNLPFYNSLPPNKQHALVAYADDFPEIGRAEAMLAVPELIDRFTPQIAAIFSEQELRDIGAIMSTLGAQSFVLRAMLSSIRGEPAGDTEATEAELASIQGFAQTPGGMALVERSDQFARLMREIGSAAGSHPRVRARVRRDICGIIADQCPLEWRAGER